MKKIEPEVVILTFVAKAANREKRFMQYDICLFSGGYEDLVEQVMIKFPVPKELEMQEVLVNRENDRKLLKRISFS